MVYLPMFANDQHYLRAVMASSEANPEAALAATAVCR